jgi:prevent-host-death family protein
MNETRVGTRELKSRLSEYLRRVKAGQTIVVTERGKVIGHIVPAPLSLDERMRTLADSGFLILGGNEKRKVYQPKVINRSQHLISDSVIEDRR